MGGANKRASRNHQRSQKFSWPNPGTLAVSNTTVTVGKSKFDRRAERCFIPHRDQTTHMTAYPQRGEQAAKIVLLLSSLLRAMEKHFFLDEGRFSPATFFFLLFLDLFSFPFTILSVSANRRSARSTQ
jgi:hypothetical protein